MLAITAMIATTFKWRQKGISRKADTGRYFLGAKRDKKEVIRLDAMKIKSIRYFLDETQLQFSKRLGVSKQTVSAIENGREVTDNIRSKLVRLEMELPAEFYLFLDEFKKSIR